MAEFETEPRAPSRPITMIKPMVHTHAPSTDAAMVGKTDRGTPETFASVVLRSPGGAFWIVQVSDTGVLSTVKLLR